MRRTTLATTPRQRINVEVENVDVPTDGRHGALASEKLEDGGEVVSVLHAALELTIA